MQTQPLTIGSNQAYLARCLNTLRDWGAPLADWICADVIDYSGPAGALATCELCGCQKVRFIHVMKHPAYPKRFEVGCICSSIMSGDELAAKNRDRLMANRAKRRTTFIRKPWRQLANGNWHQQYKGHTIFANRLRSGCLSINVDGSCYYTWRDAPITSASQARYAVFDIIDPITKIMEQEQ